MKKNDKKKCGLIIGIVVSAAAVLLALGAWIAYKLMKPQYLDDFEDMDEEVSEDAVFTPGEGRDE